MPACVSIKIQIYTFEIFGFFKYNYIRNKFSDRRISYGMEEIA